MLIEKLNAITRNYAAETETNTKYRTGEIDRSIKIEKKPNEKTRNILNDNGEISYTDTLTLSDQKNIKNQVIEEKKDETTRFREAVEKIINRANEIIFGTNKFFQYSVHKETNSIVIKILDKETKEVLKEIPPEKILDMVAEIMKRNKLNSKSLAGIAIDEKR